MCYVEICHLLHVSDVQSRLASCKVPLILFCPEKHFVIQGFRQYFRSSTQQIIVQTAFHVISARK